MKLNDFDLEVSEVERKESKEGHTLPIAQVSQVRAIIFNKIEDKTGIDLRAVLEKL